MNPTPMVRSATREVILAEGPETLAYLHGQLSQALDDLAVGESRWSFLLDPRGKVEAHLRVHRLADEVCVLDTDPAVAEAALTSLDRFKLRTRTSFHRPGWGAVSVRGDGADAVAARVTAVVDHTDVLGVWSGHDLLGPDVAVPEGVTEIEAAGWERARIDAGVPVSGQDVTGDTIPQESGLVPVSVSFTKGCYRGQELVERIDSRGAVRRRLRRLAVAGPATVGEELQVDGDRVVGRLTSVAPGPGGAIVALGMVRDDAEGSTVVTEGGASVTIGGVVGAE